MSQGTLSDVKTKDYHQLDFVFLTSRDKKFVVMWYSPPYILRKTVADDDITVTTDCPNNVWQVILCNNTVFPFSLMLLFSIHFISIDLYVLALEMVHSCINPSISCCNPSHCSIVHLMVKCAGTETFYQMCSVDSFSQSWANCHVIWVAKQVMLPGTLLCTFAWECCLASQVPLPPKYNLCGWGYFHTHIVMLGNLWLTTQWRYFLH